MKKHTVWYKSGAGGIFVAWLLQLCIDTEYLAEALETFPKKLQHTANQWKNHERIPPDIGIMCNVLHSTSPYYESDFNNQVQDTINKLQTQGYDLYDLLHCRIKYYLVNCVFKSGFVDNNTFESVTTNANKHLFNDTEYVKEQTDILFDMSKNIFVVAPESFLETAARSKNVAFHLSDINSVLLKPENRLNVFRLESIWNDTWIEELQRVLGTQLTLTQIQTCQAFISHYLELNSSILKAISNES